MRRGARSGLNDSGEDGLTRVIAKGALHFSRSQRTSRHAHVAWKIHVGLDGPVWLEGARRVPVEHGARVIIVPPNVEHATGAAGLSLAVFVAPGTRGRAWKAEGARVLSGGEATRAVELCRSFDPDAREDSDDFVEAVADWFAPSLRSLDARVEVALDTLHTRRHPRLRRIAREQGLSLDRLSHLVSAQTGLSMRRHALWSRLLRVVSNPQPAHNLAAAAADAGFADHAHMTRTFKRFLGRAPSEFRSPPDVVAPW